jgi:hypothetical protein
LTKITRQGRGSGAVTRPAKLNTTKPPRHTITSSFHIEKNEKMKKKKAPNYRDVQCHSDFHRNGD